MVQPQAGATDLAHLCETAAAGDPDDRGRAIRVLQGLLDQLRDAQQARDTLRQVPPAVLAEAIKARHRRIGAR